MANKLLVTMKMRGTLYAYFHSIIFVTIVFCNSYKFEHTFSFLFSKVAYLYHKHLIKNGLSSPSAGIGEGQNFVEIIGKATLCLMK